MVLILGNSYSRTGIVSEGERRCGDFFLLRQLVLPGIIGIPFRGDSCQHEPLFGKIPKICRDVQTVRHMLQFSVFLPTVQVLIWLLLFSYSRSKFCFPKFHSLSHYIAAIKKRGCLDGLSTEFFEHQHIGDMKAPYRKSNHRDVEPLIIQASNSRIIARSFETGYVYREGGKCNCYVHAIQLHIDDPWPQLHLQCLYNTTSVPKKASDWTLNEAASIDRRLLTTGCATGYEQGPLRTWAN